MTKAKPDAVVWDIDSTIANNKHRQKHLEGDKKDWQAFSKNMIDDTRIPVVIDLLNRLGHNDQIYIIFITGRSEENLKETCEWILTHTDQVSFDIRMRKRDDYRKSYEVKKELLLEVKEKYNVLMAFDDSEGDCTMYRDNGVTAFKVMAVGVT